ncbi:hypothetical protein ASG29_09850 [Sphingomonas sp. Leaf412]|uniref:hypothetical protein n=1 Tax=Sphingomonas sp. Leaf412 TaxID=1736370 RepID=UPI0006F4C01F|nr:hypothetical protein [Sphingomonas sp. Leaf412]KQT32134.1 hypothetical protein ASG29_09850 [Sphingomonas sp. Leaf412]
MVRPVAPLWLARPSRFAALDHRSARIVAGIAALLLVLGLATLAVPPAPVDVTGTSAVADDRDDAAAYDTIVEAVRHGADYYAVTIQEIRRADLPLPSFTAVRLPTLSVVQAQVPAPATLALLYALVATVAVAWFVRLRDGLPRRRPRLLAILLLLAGVAPVVQEASAVAHEAWAGLLVALSLAVRRPGQATAAIALALCAMLIRETAAIYAVVMLVAAMLGKRRREALGWVAALAVFGVALGVHAQAVAAVVGTFDPAAPDWGGLSGPGTVLRLMALSTALAVVPAWIALPLATLALLGWAAWRDPLGLRVLATVAACGGAMALVAHDDGARWAMLVAPVLLVGLIFAPDATRDLWRAAHARRRITVTRTAR